MRRPRSARNSNGSGWIAPRAVLHRDQVAGVKHPREQGEHVADDIFAGRQFRTAAHQ